MDDFIPIEDAFKIPASVQRERDQIAIGMLQDENKASQYPEQDIPANNKVIGDLQNQTYKGWAKDEFIPATPVGEDFIPAEPIKKDWTKGPFRMDRKSTESTSQMMIKEPIKFGAGLVAGLGALAQKPFMDAGSAINNILGAGPGPQDAGPMGYSRAFTGTMDYVSRRMEQLVPWLDPNSTEGGKEFVKKYSELVGGAKDYMYEAPSKLAEDADKYFPGIRKIYDANPAAWDTISESVPGTLEWLMMLVGVKEGKMSVKEAQFKAQDVFKNEKTEPTLIPELQDAIKGKTEPPAPPLMGQGELPLEDPIQSTTLPPNYPEKVRLAQQDLLEGAGVSEAKINPPDDLFNPKNEPLQPADLALREAARKFSQEDLLKQAEIEHVEKARVAAVELEKQRQMDRMVADREAEQVNASHERQRQIEMEQGDGSIAQMYTFGGKAKEGSLGHLLDRMLFKIADVPTERLSRIHEDLTKAADKIDFMDNSPEALKLIEQHNRVSGELAKRTNDEINARHLTQGERVAAFQKEREKAGTTEGKYIDYTLNRDSGYETQHTGQIIDGGNPEFIYVRDRLNDKVVRIDPWNIDKVYGGPKGIIYMNTFGPKMNKENATWVSDILFGAARIRADKVWEKLNEILPKTDTVGDIRATGVSNLANAHWRSANRALYGLDKPRSATTIMTAWWDNQIRHWISENHSLDAEAIFKAVEPYKNYYRLGEINPKVDLFVRDLKAALHMEKNPGEWFNGTDYYPDAAYLISKGMDPKSVKIWEGIFEMEQKMFDRINEANVNNGRKALRQIPGYLHHEFKGPYRVEMFREHTDPKTGEVTEEYLGSVGSFNRKSQKAALKELEKQTKGQNIQLRTVDPEAIQRDTAGAIKYYQATSAALDSSPGLKALVTRLYDNALDGVITEAMKRKDSPIFGHTLERATLPQDTPLGFTHKELLQSMDLFRRHFEEVNAFYIRSRFIRESMIPLVETGLLSKFPNLNQFITDSTAQFLQMNPNASNAVNAMLRDAAIWKGLDPATATHIVQGATKGTAIAFLYANIPYWIANLFQRTYSAQYLRTIHRTREMMGATTGDVFKAYKDAMAEGNFFKSLNINNKDLPPHVLKGIELGYIEPGFSKELSVDPSSTLTWIDPVAASIDRRNRVGPFVAGYHYFKQFMKEEDAIHAAGKFADGVGVTYNQKFGPQLMYQGLPDVLRPVGLFTNFASHTISLVNHMAYTAYKAAKEGNIKAAMGQVSDLASWQLTQVGLFGIAGLTLAGNYDQILRAISTLTGDYIPTTEDWAIKLNKYLPDFARNVASRGALSTITGYDIGSSGSGANWSLPTAFSNFNLSALAHVLLAGKWIAYQSKLIQKPVTLQDFADVARTTPSRMQAIDEYIIKGIMAGSLDPAVSMKTTLDKIVTQQGAKQSVGDAWIRLSTGIKSLESVLGKTAERLTDNETKVQSDLASSVIESAVIRGYPNERELKTLSEIAEQNGPDTYKTMINAVIHGQFMASMDKKTRKMYEGMSNIAKQQAYERYAKRLDLMGIK